MGYRSNVKLITTNEGWEKIKDTVQKANPDNHEYITSDKRIEELRGGYYILWTLSDVKWYEDAFPEVSAFMGTFDDLVDAGIPFQFARIGEDFDDTFYQEYYGRGSKEDYNIPTLEIIRDIAVNEGSYNG